MHTQIIRDDRKVDAIEREIDLLVVRLLALRQPMAVDLRVITASLKISSDLERMADYASNIAKRTVALQQIAPVRLSKAIPAMAETARGMIKDVLDAYADRDVARAMAVWRRDEDVDELYNSLFRELLTYMMEDPRHITPCTHLLFIAKNIERIGDHATNVAETISFMVTGSTFDEERPKGDVTSYETALPESGAES